MIEVLSCSKEDVCDVVDDMAHGGVDADAGTLEHCDFGRGRATLTVDERTGMAHGNAFGRGSAREQCKDRLGELLSDEDLRQFLLLGAADLADHKHGCGFSMGVEQRDKIAKPDSLD